VGIGKVHKVVKASDKEEMKVNMPRKQDVVMSDVTKKHQQ
jgi:hypothetical protein